MPEARRLTELLHKWRDGDSAAADEVLAATYEQLRRLARGFLRHERPDHTLQPTALVHEAYLRLFKDHPVDMESREAFFRLVAAQMRRELIDHARKRDAVKRGAGRARADFEDVIESVSADEVTGKETLFAKLDESLARLAKDHARPASVVRLRFFAGMSNEEVAERLKIGSATAKRDFAFARAWLARELKRPD